MLRQNVYICQRVKPLTHQPYQLIKPIQPITMDLSASTSMKNVVKCDT